MSIVTCSNSHKDDFWLTSVPESCWHAAKTGLVVLQAELGKLTSNDFSQTNQASNEKSQAQWHTLSKSQQDFFNKVWSVYRSRISRYVQQVGVMVLCQTHTSHLSNQIESKQQDSTVLEYSVILCLAGPKYLRVTFLFRLNHDLSYNRRQRFSQGLGLVILLRKRASCLHCGLWSYHSCYIIQIKSRQQVGNK